MRMNDTFLANGSLSARRVVARALCAERMLLSCPGRAQRDPGPRGDTTSRSHVLRFALFLRWVPALVPLAQVRSLHSAGTREQCTLLIRFSMRPIEIL